MIADAFKKNGKIREFVMIKYDSVYFLSQRRSRHSSRNAMVPKRHINLFIFRFFRKSQKVVCAKLIIYNYFHLFISTSSKRKIFFSFHKEKKLKSMFCLVAECLFSKLKLHFRCFLFELLLDIRQFRPLLFWCCYAFCIKFRGRWWWQEFPQIHDPFRIKE